MIVPSPSVDSTSRTAPPSDAGLPGPAGGWARREDVRLTTGTGTFVGDVVRENQVWLRVVRSALAHATITSVRTEAARRSAGVIQVLTAADLPRPHRIPLRIMSRPDLDRYLQPVLAAERVRYVGEPVAVVVATTQRAAEDAAELVDVDLVPLPVWTDLDADRQGPIWPQAGDRMCTFHAATGDTARAFDAAAHVVTATFETGRDTGLPLETRGLVAEWADDGRTLHLWGPTKFLRFTRRTVADWFQLAPGDVVCHHVDVGGMFGSRGEVYPEDFLVPWAASVCRRPVKWIEDRNEHLVAINHSRGQTHQITIAADAEGRFLGMKALARLDMGGYARPIGGRVVEIAAESLPGPYRWPALHITSHGVATNKTPVGTMRGPSTFDTTFARERLIDLLAAKMGIDPVELRLRNLIRADELPYAQDFGPAMHPTVYDSGDYHRVVAALLERMGYDRLRTDVERRRAGGEAVGLGVAFFLDHSGLGREETVRMDHDGAGRFTVHTTSSEIGQGLASMMARVAASVLQVPESRIETRTNQTVDFDGGNGTFASRGAIFVGSAVHDAASALLAEARRASPGVHPDDPPDWHALGRRTVVGRHAGDSPTYGFGAHLAVVRVDPRTLGVIVERLGVAYDCGRVLHPESARGQLVGAAVHGLGGALLQELTYDAQGQPQSTTFMDFLPPTAWEAPRVDVVLLELPGTVGNPLGVKGVGEAGIMGVGGSVANAVSAALGEPAAVTRLPVRPDDLMPHAPALPAPPPREGRPADVPAGQATAVNRATAEGRAARRARRARRVTVALAAMVALGAATAITVTVLVRGRKK
ncbi:xanthine dehydrogenase family protein molybdopterin-binding subunit [Actinomadura macra]|uniref:xanthine dehydrogenase family protein molybdopterin-binding subunit n=1 Tax=Actinomadura macra TaxID=46164 RepID=UPI000829E7F4|nr:xanthine dehydrogenase family protein molybdopterin-binding subunit [Actinomadura macra]